MSLSEAEPVLGWGNLSRWTLAAVRVGWCRWDIGIFPKSSQRRGTRGCRNLGLRDLDSRNERIRIIVFQNIQKNSNRSSKNIFAGRWKFMENRKNPKFPSLTELFDAYAGSQQKFMFKSYSDRYKKCQEKCRDLFAGLGSFFVRYIWSSITK